MLNAYEENDETGVKTYTEISDGQQVTMGGMIGAFKKLKTRSGSLMAFITIEDMFGSIECVCFPKIYEKIRGFLETDRVVSLSGKISIEEEKLPVIILDKMTEFVLDEKEEMPAEAKSVKAFAQEKSATAQETEKQDKDKVLWLNISDMEDEDVDELLETLCFYAGETPVYFVKGKTKMACSQKVNPNRALMAELSSFLGENCIKLV